MELKGKVKERYSRASMKELALKAIKTYRLFFVDDLWAYVPYSRALFYKKCLDKDDDIRDAIQNSKITTKGELRKKWRDNFNPTTSIALYRLICSDEEREALSYNKTEVTGAKGEPLFPKMEAIDISMLTDEEKAVLLKVSRHTKIE